MSYQNELEQACKAVMSAAEYLRVADRSDIELSCERDIKLTADKESERILIASLGNQFPILAEESGVSGVIPQNEPYWIIDPLDGSMNYHRRVKQCCISVALWKGDSPLLGVIYDFNAEELYTALAGQGALLNGKQINTGSYIEKSDAILATGIPTQMQLNAESWEQLVSMMGQYKKIRMIGSAALSLAYVAMSKFDAYYERDIMLWDVAAGLAILDSAGGVWETSKGSSRFCLTVRAAAGKQLLPE